LNWCRLFPYIERLIGSINSKSQIRFLINQLKNIISGFFVIDFYHIHINKQIQITSQWLNKHIHRFRGKNANNFICQINNQFLFSLCLCRDENDQVSHIDTNLSLDRSTIENCLSSTLVATMFSMQFYKIDTTITFQNKINVI
jgi:hypothetical protein